MFLNYFILNSFKDEVSCVITECGDDKDNKYLELALMEEAQYGVTGDRALLVLHPFCNSSIVTPAAFLERFVLE